ncbi:acetyl-CoA hydrolase/transferase family protein [Desulfoluna spongiiphila]|uniref:Acyl-CoA hydrolase n=1 Tax=Desulfoluna spongiiphila TaxID=419481 RepID=A0A1G5AEN1_9BACT|nr:acetyl-CoA hydrolase/transferase C-terminal domain-containing protein [Desulfoluna spongiiphila]SCX76346.1 Acyl-CoA hydrolase [Desulfoluna spongiiphila]
MTWRQKYPDKFVDLTTAVAGIPPNSNIAAPPASSFPLELVNALSAREDLAGTQLQSGLLMRLPDFMSPEQKGRIMYKSFFLGPLERMIRDTVPIDAISIHFSRLHEAIGSKKYDAVLLEVSPPDVNGNMSLGPMGTLAGRAMIQAAKLVIAQINPRVPFIYGTHAHVHMDEVDMVCECNRPLFEAPDAQPDAMEEKIADIISERIPDGATIQLGIGRLANAIGERLLQKKDIGIHSEMLTPSLIRLMKEGVATGAKKELHPGQAIGGFTIGSQADYDFLHKNGNIQFYPVSYVNDPRVVAKHSNFISVNNSLTIDLTGQAVSESIGFNQFSGTGGQLDFVRGARMSKGGMSFLALKSTAGSEENPISRIQCTLNPGSVVTTPRSDVQYIVTEYGIADLDKKSIPERVRAMISIAHPMFRGDLAREAMESGLVTLGDLRSQKSAA